MTQAVVFIVCYFCAACMVVVFLGLFFFFPLHTYLSRPYKTRNKIKLPGGFVACHQIHNKEHKSSRLERFTGRSSGWG